MTIATPSPRRRRLQNRRPAELFDLTFKGGRYTIGASRFPDGALAEVFIHSAKTSSNLADIARDAAVTLSLALQFGAPAAAIRAAVTREADGSPAGIVGAVLDLLAMEASQ
jgi:ribonucleoside-diphosphate reductase alpha chain